MVLLDEGASLCECHVIDDTPCFLAIVIPPQYLSLLSYKFLFDLFPLSLMHKHTHTPHPSHMWLFLHQL